MSIIAAYQVPANDVFRSFEWATHVAGLLMELLVDRTDGYGRFYRNYRSGRGDWICEKQPLDLSVIANALAAPNQNALVIGPYQGPDATKFLCFDFDAHVKPEDPPEKLVADMAKVRTYSDAVIALLTRWWHFPADALLLTTSKSGNGVHLYALLEQPIPATLAYHLLKRIRIAASLPAAQPGDGIDLYPKDPVIRGWGKAIGLPGFPHYLQQSGCLFLRHDWTPVPVEEIPAFLERARANRCRLNPMRVAQRLGLDPDPEAWKNADGKKRTAPPPAPAGSTETSHADGAKNLYTHDDVLRFAETLSVKPGEAQSYSGQILHTCECPYAAERHPHTLRSARFFHRAEDGIYGAPGFKCHHALCAGENFASVKKRFLPNFRPSRSPPPKQSQVLKEYEEYQREHGQDNIPEAEYNFSLVPHMPLTRWQRQRIQQILLTTRTQVFTAGHPLNENEGFKSAIQNALTATTCGKFRKVSYCKRDGLQTSNAIRIPCHRRDNCTSCTGKWIDTTLSRAEEEWPERIIMYEVLVPPGDRDALIKASEKEYKNYQIRNKPLIFEGWDRIIVLPENGTTPPTSSGAREVDREWALHRIRKALLHPAQELQDKFRQLKTPDDAIHLLMTDPWLSGKYKGRHRVRGGVLAKEDYPLKSLKKDREEAKERERQHDLEDPTTNRDTCQAPHVMPDGSMGRCQMALAWTLFYEGEVVRHGVRKGMSAKDAVKSIDSNLVMWRDAFPGAYGNPVMTWQERVRYEKARSARAPPISYLSPPPQATFG